VRLVYMDEAGISSPEQEPWVAVSGIIIDADKKLIAVERHLDSIVRRFIPQEHHDTFVFHATDVFGGNGKVFRPDNNRWPLERRLEIADHLAAIPKRFRLPLAFGFANRERLDVRLGARGVSKKKDLTVGAHAVSFMVCAMQVEMWMRKKTSGETCLLVVEDNDQARKLITETQTTHQSAAAYSQIYGADISDEHAEFFPLRRIKHRPLFETKAPSSALQIADFCAYVFKRTLMKDRHYDRFFRPMQEQIAVKGFSLVPSPPKKRRP